MNLVIDSTFRPFTYDEMVKPLIQYKEAYDKVEQDYSNLATQTEMWKDIVNRTSNPEAYAMWKGYSDELNNIADDLSKGLNFGKHKQALIKMKSRYASEILPIAKASDAMKEANELRIKAGPDAIFEVGHYNSLDQFLHGRTPNNTYQSKEALTKQTALMTEAAMAEAMKDPEFKKAMGDQYWAIKQHTGGSYEELMEAMKQGIMSNPIAKNRFSQIRQEMLKRSGINSYDAAGQAAIINAINMGLYAGLDKPTTQFQNNQAFGLSLMGRSSGGGSGRTRSRAMPSLVPIQGQAPEDVGEAYTANNIIMEQGPQGHWAVVGNMDPNKAHGYPVSYQAILKSSMSTIVQNQLQNSDPNQYEFYAWKTSSNGAPRVQIRRKQKYIKPAKIKGHSDTQVSNRQNTQVSNSEDEINYYQ